MHFLMAFMAVGEEALKGSSSREWVSGGHVIETCAHKDGLRVLDFVGNSWLFLVLVSAAHSPFSVE